MQKQLLSITNVTRCPQKHANSHSSLCFVVVAVIISVIVVVVADELRRISQKNTVNALARPVTAVAQVSQQIEIKLSKQQKQKGLSVCLSVCMYVCLVCLSVVLSIWALWYKKE